MVVGTLDPNPLVSGKGIARLKENGIEVIVGLLEKDCRELNKFFFCFHEKKRPYITLKWAQSSDGFIAGENNTPVHLTNSSCAKNAGGTYGNICWWENSIIR